MASDPIRLMVVVLAILALIVLITKFRVHPFIALILASWFLGIGCGLPLPDVIKHFEKGFGDVLSFVGIVIGLGAMLGGILISSGGADVLANDLIALGGNKWIPWTMFLAAYQASCRSRRRATNKKPGLSAAESQFRGSNARRAVRTAAGSGRVCRLRLVRAQVRASVIALFCLAPDLHFARRCR